MNRLLFALVDAVLWGHVAWSRARRARVRRQDGFPSISRRMRLKETTDYLRADLEDFRWWRSLWGVL